jgi:Ribbon-helix-helix domain
LTIRLPLHRFDWLKQTSRRTGVPMSEIVRQRLEDFLSMKDTKARFLSRAGAISGSRDLSSRKGFSGI